MMKNELKNVNNRDVLAYLKASFYDSYEEYVKNHPDNLEYKNALDELSNEISRLTSIFSKLEYLQNNVKSNENEVVENNDDINSLFNIDEEKVENTEVVPEVPVEAVPEEKVVEEVKEEAVSEAPVEVANTEVANTEVVPETPAEKVQETPVKAVNNEVVPAAPVETPAEAASAEVVSETPVEAVNTEVVPESTVQVENAQVVSGPVFNEPLTPTETTKKVITKIDSEMPKAILVSEKQKSNLVGSKSIQEGLLNNTVSESVSQEPVNMEAMMAQANALYKEGRVAEAQSLYDQISQLNREMNSDGAPATDDNAKVLVK